MSANVRLARLLGGLAAVNVVLLGGALLLTSKASAGGPLREFMVWCGLG